jgi:hypothetical protein
MLLEFHWLPFMREEKNKKTAGFKMPAVFCSILFVGLISVHPRQMGTTKDNT